MSFWVKVNSLSTTQTFIHSTEDVYSLQTQVYVTSTGMIQANIANNGANWTRSATGAITVGNWHHVVVTLDNTINRYQKLKIFVDGTQSAGSSNFYNAVIGNGIDLFIGSSDVSTLFLDGNIDEVSIWNNHTLTPSEISTLYNGSTPTNLNKFSLPPQNWWRMGENATFKSPQWLLPSNENKDKVSNYSMSFDGSNDYIDCGVVNQVQTFSVSMWVNPLNWGATRCAIMQGQSSNYGMSFWFMIDGTLRCLGSNGTNDSYNGNIVVNADTYLPSGSWGHILFTHEQTGTGATQKIYINGILRNTYVSTTHPYTVNYLGNPLYIAKRNNNTYFWQGDIGPVALFDNDQSLNATSIYNGGVPTDLTSLNPIAYYKMGENATLKDPQWLLPNNENKDKFSNYSMSFDGSNDYIDCGVISDLQSVTEFSISCWFKRTINIGPHDGVFKWYSSSGAWIEFDIQNDGGGNVIMANNSIDLGNYAIGTISDDTWYHAVMVFDGGGAGNSGRLKLYLNDVNITLTYTGTIKSSTHAMPLSTFQIASRFSGIDYFGGNIDEFSIWNTALSAADVTNIYNLGEPTNLAVESGLISWYRMGDDSTFSTNWTVPDQIGSNDGTSANMDIYDRVGESPSSSGNTVSYNMDIYDRVGSAPSSENNALSYNMVLSGRTTDVPT